MKAVRRILAVLHIFVGIGAMGGGLGAILNPSAPMGMPASVLRNGPFTDFLIPGIFLFVVIGLGNIGGALFLLRKSRFQGYVSGALGAVLVAWIVIQCLILWSVVALHVIFFALGALEGCLALALLWQENLFPMNVARAVLGRVAKGA